MNGKMSFVVLFVLSLAGLRVNAQGAKNNRPNILLIYTDDLGYGDISCYGATKISTPNIDKLAAGGLRFTNAYSTSATCTPSRYSLLTGQYAWRKKGTGIAPGDAALIIDTAKTTISAMLQHAGYLTGVIGKWHLGLGPEGGPNWNGEIKPGPLEIGFSHSFIIPATGDRVPCVFVKDHRVVNLEPNDSLKVSFSKPIGNEPTGKEHPELLKMMFTHDHNQTIVNGISRMGYMMGAHKARWVDENIADTLVTETKKFLIENKKKPFFLYLATHDIHVPRVPNSNFVGKSGLGPRGDAILQLDWTVGEVLRTLDSLNLTKNTIIVFSSDNGPVLNDGYKDEAVEKLNGHTPAGPLRGGKYSKFEGGTHVPLIINWPGKIKTGTSEALVSQVDFFASFAHLTEQKLGKDDATDSEDMLEAFLGKSQNGRTSLVEHGAGLAIIKHHWKYIEPSPGPPMNKQTNTELGNLGKPQLYDLKTDVGEKHNVAENHPELVKEMSGLLKRIKNNGETSE